MKINKRQENSMLNVAVVGCGYWGPNLIRNFSTCSDTEIIWCCDKDTNRLKETTKSYPNIKCTTELDDILNDSNTQAVAIATPVNTHYPIAKACLEKGKHVLIEKPMASSVEEGEKLIQLAKEKGLQLMCDHTFCYTGVVNKMKAIIDSGALGKLLYFDSVRVNLGLFQQDVNVIWDLAPHDLSILDFLIDSVPVSVSAHGVCHVGNDIENMAYVSIKYEDNFISHFHVNWLSPVKIRKTIVGGDKKMIVWDDLEADEKIKVYDKGISLTEKDQLEKQKLLVSYRSGDMYAPNIRPTEALSLMVKEFSDCISENRPAITDGHAGLRVLKILEASQKSIKQDGTCIRI
jgi:predicted dehydrogenase